MSQGVCLCQLKEANETDLLNLTTFGRPTKMTDVSEIALTNKDSTGAKLLAVS
ncbi:hypothetical protein LYNGBM3L_15520 [Moorena producens 3L]|uniref:Uncharacterized protein n=1 Tax=Moorena producens 3L TaxID=489825 RepID=F4XLR7_9CYAN|nr:hypothetical protein LYNGBM3L_15520 [Moorena producens 3L]